MEPEVIADISNLVGQPNANTAALPLLDPSIRDDPQLNPSAEVMQRLHTYKSPSQDHTRRENRAWTNIRAGR
jgi:putrescine transport system substrate-binding protein